MYINRIEKHQIRDPMEIYTIYTILWLIVAVISLIPIYIFWIGYLKLRTRDLLITAIAFSLSFVKGIILAMKLFIRGAGEGTWYLDDEFWWCIAAILDIIIIGLITFSFTNKFGPKERIERTKKIEYETDMENYDMLESNSKSEHQEEP